MKRLSTLLLCSTFLLPAFEGQARDPRVSQIPNGNAFQCMTCHNFSTGGSRNSFGQTIESDFLAPPGPLGAVVWGTELAMYDSDGDGFTNGEELGDAEGSWMGGPIEPSYTPGNPGNDMSVPRMGSTSNITIDLMGMNDDEGKSLWMRLVSVESGMEVSRTQRINISADFSVSLMGMENGKDYFVDFFIDENDNGNYDAPPTDKAWRIEVTANGQDMTQAFTSNSDYTDIKWGEVVSVDDAGNEGALRVTTVYPNPVHDVANIAVTSENAGLLTVDILDVQGNHIATIHNGVIGAGENSIQWNIANRADIPSGRYFVQVAMGSDIATATLTVNR